MESRIIFAAVVLMASIKTGQFKKKLFLLKLFKNDHIIF